MKQTHRIRAVFGGGFAVLLGIGFAAVFQTFLWEGSVTVVARTYETLSRLDGIAYSSKAAEAAVLRFVSTSDSESAAECRADLADVRTALSVLSIPPTDGAASGSRSRLAELLDEQHNGILAVLEAPARDQRLKAMATREASGAGTQLQAALQNLHDLERQTLEERIAYQAATAARARRLFLTSGIICSFLIIIAGWRFSLDLGRRELFGRARAVRNERYRQIVELASDMIVRLDEQGRFTYWNPAALQMLHYSEVEVIGRSFSRMIRLNLRHEVERFYLRQNARKRRHSYHEFPIIDGHGRERWIGLNMQVLTKGEEITGFQAIGRDLTERRRVEGELATQQAFLGNLAATVPGILYVFDLVERKIVFANRELAAVLGYKPEEGGDFGQMAVRLFHPDDLSPLRMHRESMRRARQGDTQRIEYRARHADGNWVWLSAWESPFARDADNRVTQVVGIAQDVTAHNAAKERLTWQANYDTLTRLANRQHFWTRLQSLLRRASMEHIPVSLCLFDIDRFKEINDQFGHGAGDEVLEAIGTILRSELRAEDASGRLGGDEFCFALPDVDQEETARRADRIRERLNTMAFGMTGGGVPFTAAATFGVANWQPHMGARELMEAADRALYRAKALGRNCVSMESDPETPDLLFPVPKRR